MRTNRAENYIVYVYSLTNRTIGYNQIPYPNRITNSHRATNTAAVAGAALLFAAPAIALAYWRRRKSQDHLFDEPAEEDQEVHLRQLKRFSLRELQVATDTFSNKNIIGRGGFGKVYKGCLALAFGRGGSKVLLVEVALALARLQFNSPVPNDMHIVSVPCIHITKMELALSYGYDKDTRSSAWVLVDR
ncbi:unnamed protein product [Malus baccata var. baccata]